MRDALIILHLLTISFESLSTLRSSRWVPSSPLRCVLPFLSLLSSSLPFAPLLHQPWSRLAAPARSAARTPSNSASARSARRARARSSPPRAPSRTPARPAGVRREVRRGRERQGEQHRACWAYDAGGRRNARVPHRWCVRCGTHSCACSDAHALTCVPPAVRREHQNAFAGKCMFKFSKVRAG
jgi:hypothetical protein